MALMSSSVSHRKSTAPADLVVNGNGAKYLSYREAWARITLARKHGFFLEAVTIEESIISDRPLSFLEKRSGVVFKNTTKGNFNQIIQRWLVVATDRYVGPPVELEALAVLNDRLHSWRIGRNAVVHSLVKCKASRKGDHIASFLNAAQTHACSGEKLARAVDPWVRRQGKL